MAVLQSGSTPNPSMPRQKQAEPAALIALAVIVLALIAGTTQPLLANNPLRRRPDPTRADTSRAAQQSALGSIPIEKLDPAARSKVAAVLANVTVFRRLPIRVVDCDPNLYLFLIRHPDVVVGICAVPLSQPRHARGLCRGQLQRAVVHAAG